MALGTPSLLLQASYRTIYTVLLGNDCNLQPVMSVIIVRLQLGNTLLKAGVKRMVFTTMSTCFLCWLFALTIRGVRIAEARGGA